MKISEIKKILVIGAGGTGSYVLPLLARHLYTENFSGKLFIADGDKYSEGNIKRQQFSLSHVNRNKAEYQGDVIQNHIPDFVDRVIVVDKYLSEADIKTIVENYTVVFNCVDNNAARKYVEDRCLSLEDACHICCGNEERTGQVQISLRRNGKQLTPSIYQKYPELNSTNEDRSKMSCQEIAALPGGGQLAIANHTAANLAMMYFNQLTNDKIGIFKNGTRIPYGYCEFDSAMMAFEGGYPTDMFAAETVEPPVKAKSAGKKKLVGV